MCISAPFSTAQETCIFKSNQEHASITFRTGSDSFRRITLLFKVAFKAGPYAHSPVILASHFQDSSSFFFALLAPEYWSELPVFGTGYEFLQSG